MCSFNLLQDKARCPGCLQVVQAETCAFVGCAWFFDGRKLGPDGSIICCSSDWQVSALCMTHSLTTRQQVCLTRCCTMHAYIQLTGNAQQLLGKAMLSQSKLNTLLLTVWPLVLAPVHKA